MLPTSLPPDSAFTPPAFSVPAGATDSHAHVIDPPADFPYVPERSYDPAAAPLQAYQAMHAALGLERAVIVTPSIYGTDNRATLRAIRGYGGNARGIAVVDETIDDNAVKTLHEGGMRGVRLNILFGGGVGLKAFSPLADRIRALGWHIQLLIDVSRDLADLAPAIQRARIPVVIDHMGHMPVEKGLPDPGFVLLLELVRDGLCWIKLSGNYRISQAFPGFKDAIPFAQALIQASPGHMVWGTDWPHVAQMKTMPNTGDLLNALADYAPDPALRQAILVDNPAALYGFESADR